MRQLIVFLFLFFYLQGNSQNQYNDALKLRSAIRWEYVWNITSPEAGPPTLSEESSVLYPAGFIRADTIIGTRHIHFVSQVGSPKIRFSSNTELKEMVKAILRYYSSNPAQTDFTVILAEYANNDFINPYLINSSGITAGGGLAGILNSPALSSVGGLNVTNFADGLAKFLAKRFKEELSISFFEKFKNDIKDPSYEDLRILFQQTYRLLLVIDKEIYNFNKYLGSLREAFIKDLGNLYTAFKKVKDLPKYTAYFAAHPEVNTIVLNAFYFIDQFSNGVHPGDIIANYKPDVVLNFTDPSLQTNIRSSAKTLQLFSGSLKSLSTENYWVAADSVKQMLADAVSRDMYFGLIYQKSDGINFQTRAGVSTLKDLLKSARATAGQLQEYQARIGSIIDHAQEVNEYIKELRGKKKSEIDYNDYYKLFNASFDILNEGLTLTDLPALNIDVSLIASTKAKVIECIDLARNTGELYVDVRTKNYSSAVINTIAIIDAIFASNFDSKLRDNILKYGNFAASVAGAESSDDIEKAIEAIALPVGSSRIKRESPVNISLNAYVGAFGGVEYMPTLKTKRTSGTFCFAAPVGVAFSIGDKMRGSKPNAGGKSLTLFLSIIDIGTMASFRLNDDSSKIASEVKLKNILAPGLFFYYGFGKCPISLGAGVQIGPQLREVTAKNINIEKNYYVRYGLSVCVDIPLLNLYTKSK